MPHGWSAQYGVIAGQRYRPSSVLTPKHLLERLVMWLLSRFHLSHVLKHYRLAFCLGHREVFRIGDGRAGWQRGQQPSTRARVGQAGRPAMRLAPEARRFREDLAHAVVRPPRRPAALLQGRGRDQGSGEKILFTPLHANTRRCAHYIVYTPHILASSFTRKYHDKFKSHAKAQTREVRKEWPAFYLSSTSPEWWLVTVPRPTMEIFILEVMQLVLSRWTKVFAMESGGNLRRLHKSPLKPSRLVPPQWGRQALCPQEY